MEHIHSIVIIKDEDKFLNYYDERWGMYLFPNLKGNDINKIKEKYNTSDVKLLFDKIHDKYSVSHNEIRTYHHYFYEVNTNTKMDGEFFTLDELLEIPKIKENNGDVIQFIRDYYRH